MNYPLRRSRFYEQLEDNSVTILFAGEEVLCSADQYYPFCVNNNFYYLTGIKQKQSVLVVKKKNKVITESLYVLNADSSQAKWIGEYLKFEDVSNTSGIALVKNLSEFNNDLAIIVKTQELNTIYLDLEHTRSDIYKDENFRNIVRKKYLQLSLKNCFMSIARMRSVKDDQEIACIVQAIAYTKMGLEQIRKSLKSGFYEYQLEALFNYNIANNGISNTAFQTIAASGENATVLHYVDNNCIIPENSLMLFDLGTKYQGYSSDISRTYPVGGKFDERQRILYQIVLDGQKLVINAVRPGISTGELNQLLRDYYQNMLMQIGLISQADELDNYYWHGVSHSLGLDTHDVGLFKDEPLVAGNVITVEPGLYVAQLKIGIRIEDNLLVTATGCEVLSKDIAKEIVDLEV